MKPITRKQRELLYMLGNILGDIAEQCENDENFHNVIIENNDLITMSLDELALEFYNIAKDGRKVEYKEDN